jgi:anti-sigma-K factor RskA
VSPDQTPEPTADELRELLGAYALDALDPEERAQVDALLLEDASARAELHELQHAAAWLGHASLRPPESAWAAIASEVERDLATEGAPTATESDAPHLAPVRTLPVSRAPRRMTRVLVAAAAALVLIVGAAGVFALTNDQSSPDPVAAQYAAALRNPSAREVTLTAKDGTATARAVVLPNGTGYIGDQSLPALRSGRDFQVWSITPHGPVSAGLMRDGPVHRFKVADQASALAVTNEPAGGSPEPSGPVVVTGSLDA